MLITAKTNNNFSFWIDVTGFTEFGASKRACELGFSVIFCTYKMPAWLVPLHIVRVSVVCVLFNKRSTRLVTRLYISLSSSLSLCVVSAFAWCWVSVFRWDYVYLRATEHQQSGTWHKVYDGELQNKRINLTIRSWIILMDEWLALFTCDSHDVLHIFHPLDHHLVVDVVTAGECTLLHKHKLCLQLPPCKRLHCTRSFSCQAKD